jgi:hypothetical protein
MNFSVLSTLLKLSSVGTLGRQFLRSASAQGPSIMMIPSQEMLEEEAKKCSSQADSKLDTGDTDNIAVKHRMDITMSEVISSVPWNRMDNICAVKMQIILWRL